MSDGVTDAHQAIKDYIKLCKKYNEKPYTYRNRWGYEIIDCYGKHADELKVRNKNDR